MFSSGAGCAHGDQRARKIVLSQESILLRPLLIHKDLFLIFDPLKEPVSLFMFAKDYINHCYPVAKSLRVRVCRGKGKKCEETYR
jgi:hypothetical protein